MDNNKLSWYEGNINQYLLDTIYDTDSLMIELPKDKWFKINPTRGIRNGIACYDLKLNDSLLSELLRDVYGELEFNKMIIDKQTFYFSRRSVAAGGALYPNVLYIVIKKNGKARVYQYNPALNLLHYLSSKDYEENVLEENTCYFVITNYYWKNWLKYRYFGYRLMNVDTGYLLAELFISMISKNIKGQVYIDDKYFKNMKNYIENDIGKESICAVVSAESNNLIESLEALNVESRYRVHDDWDTEEIKLYKTIEEKIINENFNVNELICWDKFGTLFEKNKWVKNRISPGGAFMQSICNLEIKYLSKTLEILKRMLCPIEQLQKDIAVFIYVNKISEIKKGLYRVDFGNKNNLQFVRSTNSELQYILKKHNFNLSETPALFFVSGDTKKYIKKYGISGFKILQIKIGFVSHLITVAAAISGCYTHPILGFDCQKAEKLLKENNLLNLIAFSKEKPTDRFIVNYRGKEDVPR